MLWSIGVRGSAGLVAMCFVILFRFGSLAGVWRQCFTKSDRQGKTDSKEGGVGRVAEQWQGAGLGQRGDGARVPTEPRSLASSGRCFRGRAHGAGCRGRAQGLGAGARRRGRAQGAGRRGPCADFVCLDLVSDERFG
jgi:hypothetical protein